MNTNCLGFRRVEKELLTVVRKGDACLLCSFVQVSISFIGSTKAVGAFEGGRRNLATVDTPGGDGE